VTAYQVIDSSRPEEPLWYLRSLPYRDYLATLHWKRLAQRLKDDRGLECEVCGFFYIDTIEVAAFAKLSCRSLKRDGTPCEAAVAAGWDTCSRHRDPWQQPVESVAIFEDRFPSFVVHHLTYDRLGEELADDLLVTCLQCNYTISYPDAHAARFWFWCSDGSTVALEIKQTRLRELQEREASAKLVIP
jgi:hypothetical protein